MNNRRSIKKGLRLEPVGSSSIDTQGELEVLSSSGKLNYHNGTSASPQVTEAHTATLTNKIIDGGNNTLQNIDLPSLKVTIADAGKFLVRDGSGNVVSNTKTVPTGVVVGTTDSQTLTNKTLTAPVINNPTGLVKGDVGLGNVDNTSDATKNSAVATLTNKTIGSGNILTGATAANLVSGSGTLTLNTTGTITVPNGTDTLVGKTTTDTLTNKTLTAPVINSPTGITKSDVGLGNVDNTSDATKNAASVTLTNKTIGSGNILTGATAANLVSGSGTLTLNATGTITVPNATDTLTGKATTDTLTNKTIGDSLTFAQISTPSNPAANKNKIYFKNDNNAYYLNSSGTEVQFSASTTSPVVVRASKGSSQTLPNSVDTLVGYPTVDIDTHSAWSTNTFTCPVTGYYRLSIFQRLNFENADWQENNIFRMRYYKNGSPVADLGKYIQPSAGNDITDKNTGGTDVVSLTVGDTINFYAYQDSGNGSGGDKSLSGSADQAYITITKVN